jgi:hypothetical protein
MIRQCLIVLSSAALFATPALAAPCRDAHGKFVKCPTAHAAAKPVRCKGVHGKFAKCGAPGAKPA